MKKHFSTVLVIMALVVGLILLLYPTMSDYFNQKNQTRMIATYSEQIENTDTEVFQNMKTAASRYNAGLNRRSNPFELEESQSQTYDELLNLDGTGVMGYVDIPSIKCTLPLYHGTDESVLRIAVGHIEWSSLPVGGESTHTVLSGHRGLPSAKLFTDLDQLMIGDVFYLQILDETLTYEVDQILTVEPTDTTALQVVEGKDYCTLVTCTPYGVNSHRLLVRGHRISNTEEAEAVRVTADAIQVDAILVTPIVAIPLLAISLSIVSWIDRRRWGRR